VENRRCPQRKAGNLNSRIASEVDEQMKKKKTKQNEIELRP